MSPGQKGLNPGVWLNGGSPGAKLADLCCEQKSEISEEMRWPFATYLGTGT